MMLVMGGMGCHVCGKLTHRSELADLFGKSDRMQAVCDDHAVLLAPVFGGISNMNRRFILTTAALAPLAACAGTTAAGVVTTITTDLGKAQSFLSLASGLAGVVGGIAAVAGFPLPAILTTALGVASTLVTDANADLPTVVSTAQTIMSQATQVAAQIKVTAAAPATVPNTVAIAAAKAAS
jgi:hypothetical protein